MSLAAASAPAWHPAALAARRANLAARARIQSAFRGWFGAAGFAEVETPSLQVSPGLEVHLIAFATELRGPYAGEARQLYLHTSPEFAMKKLLAGGMERIFQFARVWRNGERSPTHHPEFTMLEWYRTGVTYEALMEDCVALVRAAFTTAGRRMADRGGMTCDVFAPWERLSVADAFTRHTGIDVLATAPDPWAPDVTLLAEAARKAGITPHDGDTWEDLFFRILLERIEPHLGEGAPTILCDYPVSMAALSRPSPKDGRVAERFELYVSGVELANAFSELTDPAEQRRRFEADMDMKERLYGERYPIDEDFLAAVAAMPDCAGIALGFDRLVMLATGAQKLEEVLWLPVAPVA
ncbi:EF-P lysine aminoacylase EpmA [Radicibacter daui]|uniref:EF-P lysine aminoacylase EpmA n=1 Tax=Radicibacter daui TaxID=3064829 RepID=UPI004046D4B8